jgi:hypothetical protein
MLNIGLQQQQQIRGADGTLLWSGAQVIGASYIATSTEAANAFAMGEGALWDPATVSTGFIPRQETTAAGGTPTADLPLSLVLGIKRLTAVAGGVGFLGVTQEPIAHGQSGLVAGAGSLTTVKCETGATIAVGGLIGSTGTTIGLVGACGAKAAAVPPYGTVLGVCLKTNTAGADGTGSTGWAGVLVMPQ